MRVVLNVLAATAWLVSATSWWRASRRAPALPPLTADAGEGWEQPLNAALSAASRRNTYAAASAMVAALLQAAASVVR